MKSIFKLLDINNETQWQDFLAYNKLKNNELNPDDNVQRNESVRREIIQWVTQSDFGIYLYLVYVDEILVGDYFCGYFKSGFPSYSGNKSILSIGIFLLLKFRNQGISTKILNRIVEFGKNNYKTLFIRSAGTTSGKYIYGCLKLIFPINNRLNKLNFIHNPNLRPN